jgi:hypothetical protein
MRAILQSLQDSRPMPSSPPRSHHVRERDKLTLQGYFTTSRAPLRARPCGRGDQGSGVAGMIRVTRDKAKLRDDDFVWVIVERRNASSEAQATVRGACAFHDPEQGYVASNLWLPIEEAFRQACDVAKKKGLSAIWIDDPDLRFDFKPWEQVWLG